MENIIKYIFLIPVSPVQFILCVLLLIVKDFLGMKVAAFLGGGLSGPLGLLQLRASFWRMVILGEIILFVFVKAQGSIGDGWMQFMLFANLYVGIIVMVIAAFVNMSMRDGEKLMRHWEQENKHLQE